MISERCEIARGDGENQVDLAACEKAAEGGVIRHQRVLVSALARRQAYSCPWLHARSNAAMAESVVRGVVVISVGVGLIEGLVLFVRWQRRINARRGRERSLGNDALRRCGGCDLNALRRGVRWDCRARGRRSLAVRERDERTEATRRAFSASKGA